MSQIHSAPAKTNFDYRIYGFTRPEGSLIRKTEIAVYIVIRKFGDYAPATFGVYLRHGQAGGAFYRNSEPLVETKTLVEAKQIATGLYGIAGSGEFAEIIDDRR